MRSILALLCLGLLAASSASPITGDWAGTATLAGESRAVSLHVERTEAGLRARYSIPELDLEEMPLPPLQLDSGSGALSAGHAFDGKFDGSILTGQLRAELLHGNPAAVTLARAPAVAVLGTDERPVQFVTRGVRLKGTLVRPLASGRYPALVSLHGSGPSTRWFALSRARRFARAGYAMLISDKPGSGESEGDWTMTSLDEMAADAVAAVEFLRSQPDIDPARVGLWGHSQAGMVIGRAVPMSDSIAFAIVLAGGGVTPREVEIYGYRNRLREAGAKPEVAQAALRWVDRYLDYEASGQGYAAIVAQLNAHPDWKQALGVSTVYPLPEQQSKWSWVATYDPRPDIAKIKIPVLLMFAQDDVNTPSSRSLAAWRAGLSAAGNRQVEWRTFANADHHFLLRPRAGGWPALAPGYHELQLGWLGRLFGDRGERR